MKEKEKEKKKNLEQLYRWTRNYPQKIDWMNKKETMNKKMRMKRQEKTMMMVMVMSNKTMNCLLLLVEEADKNRHQFYPYPSR